MVAESAAARPPADAVLDLPRATRIEVLSGTLKEQVKDSHGPLPVHALRVFDLRIDADGQMI